MAVLTFYLIGVAIAAFGAFLIVCKDLEANPDMTFTVGDLLLFLWVSLFSWFLVLVLLNEGCNFLVQKYSVSQKVQDFLRKDLRKKPQ